MDSYIFGSSANAHRTFCSLFLVPPEAMGLSRMFRRKSESQSTNKAERASSSPAKDDQTEQWSRMKSESLILVMGVTGAGKSYFINKLKANSVAEGHDLTSRKRTAHFRLCVRHCLTLREQKRKPAS